MIDWWLTIKISSNDIFYFNKNKICTSASIHNQISINYLHLMVIISLCISNVNSELRLIKNVSFNVKQQHAQLNVPSQIDDVVY